MSIYGSLLNLGRDPHDPDAAPPETWPRAYLGSHIYPHPDHPAAYVDTAAIPHWCIPGHDESADPGGDCPTCDAEVDGYAAGLAPWLRLSIGTDEYGRDAIDVTVPAAGVERLRDFLTDWLDRVSPAVKP